MGLHQTQLKAGWDWEGSKLKDGAGYDRNRSDVTSPWLDFTTASRLWTSHEQGKEGAAWLGVTHVKAAVGREITTVASTAMCRCSEVHVRVAAPSDRSDNNIEQ